LLIGVIAMFTRKGSRPHRRAGLVYVVSMLILGITALVMSIIWPNPFLFAVAIFSAAMALLGWLPARGDNPQLGKIIGTASFVAAALLFGVGLWWIVTGDFFGIAAIVFGVISTPYGWQDVRRTREQSRQQRIIAHVSAMRGAFIATVSVVFAVNLELLPPLVRWL
jgi:asparagine N-glycosylation enzyme membrane subunit Stt3